MITPHQDSTCQRMQLNLGLLSKRRHHRKNHSIVDGQGIFQIQFSWDPRVNHPTTDGKCQSSCIRGLVHATCVINIMYPIYETF
jgi:hypothetical protein